MIKSEVFIFMSLFIFSLAIMELMWGKPTKNLKLKKEDKTNKISNKKLKYKELTSNFYIKNASISGVVAFLVMYFFLRSIGIALVSSLIGLIYPFFKHKQYLERRKKIMNVQLREAMYSIANSLKAGNSLQRAIENCIGDLKITLTSYKEKPILEELELIVYDFQLGKSLDEALISFKDRVQLEDVDTFVTAAIITKQKGGNLTEVMKKVTASITDKLEIKRDILILTASKRSEAKLLTFMPIMLVVILSILAPSYMAPMYNTLLGKLLMFIGISLLAINYVLGQKIIDIDI